MFRHTSAGRTPAQATPLRDPRQRLLDAIVETVALHGYERTTVGRVLSTTGLEEAVFAEHFHDKRDCFLQALDELIAHGEQVALELFELDLPWSERMRLGLERLLAALAGNPAAARVLLVELFSAGPLAVRRQRLALELFVSLVEQGRPQNSSAAQLPAQTSEAIVGGVVSILHRRALQGQMDELPALYPDLTYFALLPYLGHERALTAATR